MSTYREEADALDAIRSAYSELDSELLAVAKTEGDRLSLESRFRITAKIMAARRAIFGSLLPPPVQPTPEDIESGYLDAVILPLRRR